MNRRRAIGSLVVAGIAGASVFTGMEWFKGRKKPDLQYLDHSKSTIAALAESIIPLSNTPGAGACGLDDFIVKMVKDCTTEAEKNLFIDGLKKLQDRTQDIYGKKFEVCSMTEKKDILQHFERVAKPAKGLLGKIEEKYLPKPFFTLLKEYAVLGYCTSEIGATQGLSYVLIPGAYRGCLPLQAGQKAWATR
jgi:hypothetical protein